MEGEIKFGIRHGCFISAPEESGINSCWLIGQENELYFGYLRFDLDTKQASPLEDIMPRWAANLGAVRGPTNPSFSLKFMEIRLWVIVCVIT